MVGLNMLSDKAMIIYITKYEYERAKTLGLIKIINNKERLYGCEFKIIELLYKSLFS